MKSKLLAGMAAISACFPALLAAAGAAEEPVARKMPELALDRTPVARTGVVTSYADVIEPMQKAVVSVFTTFMDTPRRTPLMQQLFPDMPAPKPSEAKGLGSGVIVSADGYIVTNSHVVSNADTIEVLLADDRRLKARVIGVDPKTDIAVIKVEAESLSVATLADSDNLRVGDLVFAIGNPLEVGQTVTMGIVSAKGRHVGLLDNGKDLNGYEDFIQTDAAINLGNSGGALVDAKGRLIGINSAIVSNGGGDSGGNIGIGFAVPVNIVYVIMRNLIETGTVSRGYLGLDGNALDATVALASGLSKDAKGFIISSVVEGTPASKAGLKPGDVLAAVDDKAVATREALKLIIAQKAPNSVVRLKYFRDGKERTVEISLDKLAEDAGNPNELLDGIKVGVLTDELRKTKRIAADVDGLLVGDVDPKSPYASALQEGMVVLVVGQTPAIDVETARKALHPGANKLLVRDRKGVSNWIGIEVK